ncbi:MAG: hypothetical protein ABEJ94_06805 [Halorientalis sp.]
MSSTDDNDVYTVAQLREYLDGRTDRDPEAFQHAGIVQDERVSKFLTAIELAYDPLDTPEPGDAPARADQLNIYQSMQRAAATEDVREGIEAGDTPRLKHHVGDPEQRSDLSGLHAIEELKDRLDSAAPLFYLIGHMGTGKTWQACLFAQLYHREHPDAKLITNIQTLDPDGVETVYAPNWTTLKDAVEEPEHVVLAGEATPKFILLDEASSWAQGYETRQKLGPMMFKIRKNGGAAAVVGHDGKNVTPIVRELADIVEKESTKQATLYRNISNRDPQDEIVEFDGIPEPDPTWQPNTNDVSDFTWDDEDGADADDGDSSLTADTGARYAAIYTAIEEKKNGASDREAAKSVPYSKSWVNSRWQEYQDGELDEVMDTVEQLTG